MSLVQNSYIKIELKEEWMSNPEGMEMVIHRTKARDLVERGVARYIEEPEEIPGMITVSGIDYYPVKLLREWMGHPKGSKLTLAAFMANELIGRRTAKLLTEKQVGKEKNKELKEPVKDKMFKRPGKSK